jgi:hypothetical protein
LPYAGLLKAFSLPPFLLSKEEEFFLPPLGEGWGGFFSFQKKGAGTQQMINRKEELSHRRALCQLTI